jgi:hypothetical protein
VSVILGSPFLPPIVRDGGFFMFTVKSVAELLSSTVEHVRDLINNGDLHAVNIARSGSKKARWRVPVDELERFTAARTQTPKPTTRRKRRTDSEVVPYYSR